MAIFCDLAILFLAAVLSIVKSGLLPLEELEAVVQPYTGPLFAVMVGFFVLKYVVYEVFMFRDIRYINSVDNDMPKSDYYILAAYPVCDLVRMLMMVGIVSAVFHNQVGQYGTFGSAVSYIALIVLLIAIFFVDYFIKDAERILSHLIPTAVLVVLVLVVSKGMFLQGLKLI